MMICLLQDNGMLKIHTHPNLCLTEFNGVLSISEEYCFNLKVGSQVELNFEKILGHEIGFSVGDSVSPNYFHGEVFKISHESSLFKNHFIYTILVRPSLSRLTLISDCRIYQRLNVIDVIKTLLKDHCKDSDFSLLKNTYPKLYFKMQYKQTHYDFFNYLAAEAGIFYFFTFHKDRHVLNFADSVDRLPNYKEPVATHLYDWQTCISAKSNSVSKRGFNFLTPEKPVSAKATSKETQKTPFKIKTDLFEYSGGLEAAQEAEEVCQKEMTVIDLESQRFVGRSHCYGFIPAMKFMLDENEYLVNRINYRASDDQDSCYNLIECSLSEKKFQKILRKKNNIGTQSATVVGVKNQDIYTDKYARIKVQFPWDRFGKKDENSSTWLRVSQWWSGQNFGAQFIPHVGQEVQIDFLNGDCNKPVVTGSLYNNEHKSPFDFASQSYFSAIKTKENTLLFSDKKKSQQFVIEASKDYLLSVGQSAQVEIENNDQQTISQGNQETHVSGSYTVVAKESIVYSVGESQLKITGDQIELRSDFIKINS